MANIIRINDITGVEPYNIFLCDEVLSLCVYVTPINNSDIPYEFEPPSLLQSNTSYVVKVIDSRPCEIISNTVS